MADRRLKRRGEQGRVLTKRRDEMVKMAGTHVHLDVGFLRVHVTVVVRVVRLHVANVVRLRHAVHQVTIQLVGVTQNLRGYDRSVAAECLKPSAVRLEFLARISNREDENSSVLFRAINKKYIWRSLYLPIK